MSDFKIKKLNYNKRAQISQTLVWILATILIIGILIISILFSFSIAKVKQILGQTAGQVNSGLGNSISFLEMKTYLAYQLNSNNKDKIEEILRGKA